MNNEVCSVCGAALSFDNSPGRADTYASYTCSHGPTANYDYDRGTGSPGAPTVSREEYYERQPRWDDR